MSPPEGLGPAGRRLWEEMGRLQEEGELSSCVSVHDALVAASALRAEERGHGTDEDWRGVYEAGRVVGDAIIEALRRCS